MTHETRIYKELYNIAIGKLDMNGNDSSFTNYVEKRVKELDTFCSQNFSSVADKNTNNIINQLKLELGFILMWRDWYRGNATKFDVIKAYCAFSQSCILGTVD